MRVTSLAFVFAAKAKACIWGRCNGTRGAEGRCNVCGSKRP